MTMVSPIQLLLFASKKVMSDGQQILLDDWYVYWRVNYAFFFFLWLCVSLWRWFHGLIQARCLGSDGYFPICCTVKLTNSAAADLHSCVCVCCVLFCVLYNGKFCLFLIYIVLTAQHFQSLLAVSEWKHICFIMSNLHRCTVGEFTCFLLLCFTVKTATNALWYT